MVLNFCTLLQILSEIIQPVAIINFDFCHFFASDEQIRHHMQFQRIETPFSVYHTNLELIQQREYKQKRYLWFS